MEIEKSVDVGIFIIRKWMDRVQYSREGDKNRLTLYKTVGGKKAAGLFRNVKIGTKILFVVLSVSLLTLSIISVISYTQMRNLAKYSQDANVQLGNTAAFESKNALMHQAQEQADDIYGAATVETGGEEYYLFSAPLAETDWKLCVMIPVQEIIAPTERTQAKIDAFTLEAQNYIKKPLFSAVMRFVVIFVVSAILVVALSYTLSLAITRPIEALSRSVRKIGEGALDIQIPVNGSDEVAELGKAFNKMTGDLKGHILNIEKAAAEKERINSELAIAADIQNDMLPAIFPKFSGNEYFSVFARMVPAKEVGGDFYDFFYLDEKETKLALVIADVSGKGVPASLFMVIAKTLVKQWMLQTNDPAGTLTAVNRLLCENNPRSMFVTVLICSIDLASGEMMYANAGHNPPLVSVSGGRYQFMELKKGLPPGMMETSVYRQCSMKLHPGDRLYLYTDGINEAMNRENREWGNDRFLETVNRYIDLGPAAFDAAIRARLAEFVSGAEQSDDITTIAFTYGNAGLCSRA